MTVVPLEIAPQDAEGHLWDAIVIGTGAGGSTAGFSLARLGRSVLFVERGKLLHHDPTVVRGVPFHGPATPKRRLTTAGGHVLSIIGKKRARLQFLRGRLSVVVRVDRQLSSTQSWTGFVQKTSRRVVFFWTCLMRHCLKRGQSATRKWRHFTSGRRVCIGCAAHRTHSHHQ